MAIEIIDIDESRRRYQIEANKALRELVDKAIYDALTSTIKLGRYMGVKETETRRSYLLKKWKARVDVFQTKQRILGKALRPDVEIARNFEQDETKKRQTQRQTIQTSKRLHKAQRWDGHRP